MTSVEINQISIRTVDQGDDESGEWVLQRRGRVTASLFGDIVRRKAAYAPLVQRLLYSKTHRTKAMQYSHNNEPKARDMYCEYLHKFRHKNATVEKQDFIKTSGSESRPRKVELASAHKKKRDDYREYFTHNNEACKNPYKTTLPH